MNVSTILEWIKSNVFIVVFVALMIAAPLAMLFVTSGMNQDIRKEVGARAQKISELKRLENGTIPLPDGSSVPGMVNQEFLKQYREVAEAMGGDAAAVRKAAVEHNRKNRGVVMRNIFPEMPATQRDVLPEKFHAAVVAAYDNLLTEINAGQPPTLESMRQELETRRTGFITQDLRKTSSDTLTTDEQTRLQEELTNLRMSRYAQAAEKVGIYVSAAQLGVPAFDRTRQPTMDEMFAWQWQFWVTHDILKALSEANKEDRFVIRAPVKQVLRLSALNVSGLEAGSGGGGWGYGGGAAADGGFGGGGSGSGDGSDEGAHAGGAAPDPKIPVPKDLATISGRRTNPLYDVIDVELVVVVESGRLPQVLDALARYNFITVTDLSVMAADPFEAARGGFFYGDKHVATVGMRLETVWLREWTQQFMPDSVKRSLGLPVGSPPPAGSDSSM